MEWILVWSLTKEYGFNDTSILDFRLPQCERIYFCCFKPSSLQPFIWQPWKTNIGLSPGSETIEGQGHQGLNINISNPLEVSRREVEGKIGSFQTGPQPSALRHFQPSAQRPSSSACRAAEEGTWPPAVSRKPQEWPVIMALRRASTFRLIYLLTHLSCISSLLAYFVLYLIKWRENQMERE